MSPEELDAYAYANSALDESLAAFEDDANSSYQCRESDEEDLTSVASRQAASSYDALSKKRAMPTEHEPNARKVFGVVIVDGFDAHDILTNCVDASPCRWATKTNSGA